MAEATTITVDMVDMGKVRDIFYVFLWKLSIPACFVCNTCVVVWSDVFRLMSSPKLD